LSKTFALDGNTKLSLEEGTAELDGLPCPSPTYGLSSESIDDFVVDFRVRAGDVGITNGPVSILRVNCSTYGYSLVHIATHDALVIYEGHFFFASKQD
jgi:hypothetical protein